jgi:DNA-binding transcriptional LysR family regulator
MAPEIGTTMDTRKIESLWSHVHGLGVLQSAGSFTAAAQRLGLSKAAMSQRIAELERAAGVPLVRRTTRSVRLTEAGERLVEATRGAFAQIEQGFAGVQDLVGEPHGVLRVSAPVALGRQQIVPRLAGFLRAYPQVRVELELSDRLVAMTQEGFDVALRHTAAPPDTHVAWPLCTTRSWLVASRAYLRRAGAPATPADSRRTTACTTCAPATRRPGASSRTAGAQGRAGPRQRRRARRLRGQQQRGACARPRSPAWASRCCPTSAPRPRCESKSGLGPSMACTTSSTVMRSAGRASANPPRAPSVATVKPAL